MKLLLLLEEDDSEGGMGIDAGSWIRLNRPPWIGGTKLTQGPATRPIRYRNIDCRVSLECSLQQLSTFLTRAVESFLFQNLRINFLSGIPSYHMFYHLITTRMIG